MEKQTGITSYGLISQFVEKYEKQFSIMQIDKADVANELNDIRKAARAEVYKLYNIDIDRSL